MAEKASKEEVRKRNLFKQIAQVYQFTMKRTSSCHG